MWSLTRYDAVTGEVTHMANAVVHVVENDVANIIGMSWKMTWRT